MRLFTRLSACAVLLLVAGCTTARPDAIPSQPSNSVWAIDLIRTLPGQQAEYLRSIQANWGGARNLARERGAVLSYRALASSPDSSGDWDVLLMTEYADSVAWAQREVIFQAIFAAPDYVRVPTALPSSELRTFFGSGVVMREIVSGGSR
jgi:hypothetical protein